MLKSKYTLKNPIDWSKTITLDDLKVDRQIFEIHKKRIWETFQTATEEIKQRQLENLILRDNLFNVAMEHIVSHYEFELDDAEIEQFAQDVIKNFGESKKEVANEIAKKLIQKILVFENIQADYKITIDDAEYKKIIDDFYKATNKSVRRFYEDETEKEKAKRNLLEEKTMAFILDKFPKDLTKLQENMKRMHAEATEKAKAEAEQKANPTTTEEQKS